MTDWLLSPRTSADLEWLGGDPYSLRACADDLRSLADDLDVSWTAAHELEQIREGTSWYGEGFDAYRSTLDRNPESSDITNAQTTLRSAAGALDTVASRIADCQSTVDWCRQRIDSLNVPAEGDIPEDLRVEVDAVWSDYLQAREDYDGYLSDAAGTFDELTDRTIYAEPPSGGLFGGIGDAFESIGDAFGGVVDVVTEFSIGVVEGVAGIVEGVYVMVQMSTLIYRPWEWDDAVTTALTLYDAFVADPQGFLLNVGRAAVDWDTLMTNPARWVGRLVPTVVLAVATGGAGTAATGLARAATVASRTSRFARVGSRLDGLSRGSRRVDDVMNVPNRLATSGPASVQTALHYLDTVSSLPGAAATSAWRSLTGRSGNHEPVAPTADPAPTNPANGNGSGGTTNTNTNTNGDGGSSGTTDGSGSGSTTGDGSRAPSPAGGSDPASAPGSSGSPDGGDPDVDVTDPDPTGSADSAGSPDPDPAGASDPGGSPDGGDADVDARDPAAGGTPDPDGTTDHSDSPNGGGGDASDAADTTTLDTTGGGPTPTNGDDPAAIPTATDNGNGDQHAGTGNGPDHRPIAPRNLRPFQPDASSLDGGDRDQPGRTAVDLRNTLPFDPDQHVVHRDQHPDDGGTADADELDQPELVAAGVANMPIAVARHTPGGGRGGSGGRGGRGPAGPGGPHHSSGAGSSGGSGSSDGGGSRGRGPGGPGGPGGPHTPGGAGDPADPNPSDDGPNDSDPAAIDAESVATAYRPWDPDEHPWLGEINPTGDMRNCLDCTRAVDDRLSGRDPDATAAPGRPIPTAADLARRYGGRFEDVGNVPHEAREEIVRRMLALGPGARGFVRCMRPNGFHHVFNVEHRRDERGSYIRFIDGQGNGPGSFSSPGIRYNRFRFMHVPGTGGPQRRPDDAGAGPDGPTPDSGNDDGGAPARPTRPPSEEDEPDSARDEGGEPDRAAEDAQEGSRCPLCDGRVLIDGARCPACDVPLVHPEALRERLHDPDFEPDAAGVDPPEHRDLSQPEMFRTLVNSRPFHPAEDLPETRFVRRGYLDEQDVRDWIAETRRRIEAAGRNTVARRHAARAQRADMESLFAECRPDLEGLPADLRSRLAYSFDSRPADDPQRPVAGAPPILGVSGSARWRPWDRNRYPWLDALDIRDNPFERAVWITNGRDVDSLPLGSVNSEAELIDLVERSGGEHRVTFGAPPLQMRANVAELLLERGDGTQAILVLTRQGTDGRPTSDVINAWNDDGVVEFVDGVNRGPGLFTGRGYSHCDILLLPRRGPGGGGPGGGGVPATDPGGSGAAGRGQTGRPAVFTGEGHDGFTHLMPGTDG